jgi:hypothetical protein
MIQTRATHSRYNRNGRPGTSPASSTASSFRESRFRFLCPLVLNSVVSLSGFLTARFMLRLRAWDKAGVHVSGKSHPTTGVSDTVHTMQFHERNSFFDEWKGDIGPARDAPSESDLSTKAESSSGRVHEILKPSGSSDQVEMDESKSWGTRHGSEGRV